MKEIIKRVDEFMVKEIMKLQYYQDNNKRMAQYRIEHSRRVANIARNISLAEGFDEDFAYIGGLLHDIGYAIDYKTKEDYRNHGRYGAKIARPFLLELGINEDIVNEICYGIAIHVDDEADFDGERTALALCIGDADNIDRFDAFRLFESVLDANYRELPLNEQYEFCTKRIERLKLLIDFPMSSKTARDLWQEKIRYQISFIERLKKQVDNSYLQTD